MISLTTTLTPPPPSSSSTSFKSPLLSTLRPIPTFATPKILKQRRSRNRPCRAELSRDAPFVVAIGACIISSFVLPLPSAPNDDEEEEGKSVIDTADARFAVMGIISFIPYFNWLSWVFACMDTGRRRYLAHALVYLASYLRSNLSLSPEESWLPIASIIFCIIHIQLEASIKNGDLQGFRLFSEGAKDPQGKEDTRIPSEEGRKDVPCAQEQSQNELGALGVPRKPSLDPVSLNENEVEDERKHQKASSDNVMIELG